MCDALDVRRNLLKSKDKKCEGLVETVVEIQGRMHSPDLPDGSVVKNLPHHAEKVGSIPGEGTQIPHSVGQLSP